MLGWNFTQAGAFLVLVILFNYYPNYLVNLGTVSAGQSMKQMIMWSYFGFLHFFVPQTIIVALNNDAATRIWRVFKNNRPEPHHHTCG